MLKYSFNLIVTFIIFFLFVMGWTWAMCWVLNLIGIVITWSFEVAFIIWAVISFGCWALIQKKEV